MKNLTIWESASRPLFVRTVWLEGSDLRRGFQRHFLLDYNTNRPFEKLNSTRSPLQTQSKVALKPSISLDLNHFTKFNDESEVFLVGSAKIKLHKPSKTFKLFKYRRRSSLLNRQHLKYDNDPYASSKYFSRRPSNVSQSHSRKNSLTQAQQQTAAATHDFLAERVLNWLDLAGHEDVLKNPQNLKEVQKKLSQDVIKSCNTTEQNTKKSQQHKTKAYQRATTVPATATTQINQKPAKAVKHITITFNKEDQPIPFTMLHKNIGLSALSASSKTTGRMTAGKLSTVRLFKSAETQRYWSSSKKPYLKCKTSNEARKSLSAHKRLDTVADLTNSTLQKRLHESADRLDSYDSLHESKQQLHIFMPTLPEKGELKSVCDTEDGFSELSHNFSELCKI